MVAAAATFDPDDGESVGFYNRALIDLSARAGDARALDGATRSARAHSPICGSTVEVFLTEEGGRITGFGYALEACALTKSVVAVMQDAILGADFAEVEAAHRGLQQLLAGDADAARATLPAKWHEMLVLAPLKDHRVRHNAMQLPFEAVEKALQNKPV